MPGSEEIKKQVQATEQLNSEQEQNLRITRDINNEIREGLKLINQEKDLKTEVRKAINEVAKAQSFQVDISKDVNKALTDTAGLLKKQQDLSKATISLEKNRKDLSKKIFQEANDLAATRNSLSDKEVEAIEKQIEASKGVARALRNQIQQQKHAKKVLDSQVEVAKQLADLGSVKLFGSLSAIAGAIPGVKNLTKGFDKAAEAAAEAAASSVKIEDGVATPLGPLDKLKAGFKGLTAGVGEMMKSFSGIAIFGKLVQGVLKADKGISAIAQGLNVSGKEAKAISGEITKIKSNSEDVFLTYGNLKHALLDINKQLGTSGMINKETLKTFVSLNKRAGLTEESLMGMTRLSLATGGNLEDMTGEFLAQAKITSTNQKVILNEKQLFDEISKLSAATTLSLGKNPGQLAKAVATAKSLGFEMSNLESIAGSLLDFESSIEKELEAELMLGKNLNLEKARQAALNNDLATVAEEIAKQAGSAADFAKMNRLQQEALADAVGMSREDLAQTLFVQEQLRGVTEGRELREKQILDLQNKGLSNEEIKKELAKTSIKDLESQASKQAEMAAATEQLNETFMELGKNLTPILGQISEMVALAARNVEFIIAGVAAYKAYQTYQKVSMLLEKRNISLKGKGIGKQIASLAISAADSVAKIPVVGAVLAVAAGLGAYALGKSLLKKGESETADDFMSPGAGSGYGNRMITAPEGTFALNNKDTIIAGTNLDQGGGGSVSSAKLEELQAQTNTLLSQLLNKNASIRMDSEELGTAISLNNYEVSA